MQIELSAGVRVAVRQPVPPRFAVQPPTATRAVAVPVRGPAGPSGNASGVVHTQTSPAATWTITHGLGRVPDAVTVLIAGELVDTDTVLDATHVVLTFASPTTGEVHIL